MDRKHRCTTFNKALDGTNQQHAAQNGRLQFSKKYKNSSHAETLDVTKFFSGFNALFNRVSQNRGHKKFTSETRFFELDR